MKLVIIVMSLLFLGLVSGEIPTKTSPAPAPELANNAADSPPIQAPAPEIRSPSPAKSPSEYSSPPEPEAENSPSPSPSPSDSPSISPPSPDDYALPPPTPTPSPSSKGSDVNHSDITGIENEENATKDGGMSGGTKAGVAFGVIAAVCVVGLAGFVYKKRQDNIRRSRYGYAARDIL